MEQNCNVIRDLLPLYMEKICSEESEHLVEEHLQQCKSCQNLADMMQKTELISEEIEKKEINYWKKVKQHSTQKSLILFGLLVLAVLVGMTAIVINRTGIPIWIYYGVMPVFMVGAYLVQSNEIGRATSKRFSGILGIISVVLFVYTVAVQFILTRVDWQGGESLLLGMPAEKIGPFISMQFLIIAVIQLVIWIAFIYINVRYHNTYGVIQNISLVGSCVAFAFVSLMRELSSVDVVGQMRNQMLFVLLVEGIAVSGILILIEYKNYKKCKK